MNSRCFVVTIDDSKQSAKVISLVSVLKSLGRSDDLLSDSYVDDVVEKLPVSLRTKWIDSTKDRPGRRNLESLAERLEDRAHTWDIVQGIADSSRIKAERKTILSKSKVIRSRCNVLGGFMSVSFQEGPYNRTMSDV